MKFDKPKLIQSLIQSLEDELLALKTAAQATYQAATHEESKPENEYDTFALEASYLAGAQAKRAGEIDEVISMFKNLNLRNFAPHSEIDSTALVEVASEDHKKSLFLMVPLGGGFNLQFEGRHIQLITPHSLLGEALVGLKAGDVAEIEINGRLKEFEILQVW